MEIKKLVKIGAICFFLGIGTTLTVNGHYNRILNAQGYTIEDLQSKLEDTQAKQKTAQDDLVESREKLKSADNWFNMSKEEQQSIINNLPSKSN